METSKRKILIKKITGVVGANIVSMLMSAIITLIVPKIVGIYEYGCWQLFVFYGSYLAYTSLGWNDGLYLEMGGEDYYKLDKRRMSSQFWMSFFYETIVTMFILGICIVRIKDGDKLFIISWTVVSTIIGTMRLNLQMLLQATGQIKVYVRSVLLENAVLFGAVMISLATKTCDYKLMIYADTCGRLGCLLLLIFSCRDIVFSKIYRLTDAIKTVISQVLDGMQLFLANISNNLIIGISRFAIEYVWGTIVFGQVALSLTMTNLITNCINAISIVLFPALRRVKEDRLKDIYFLLTNALMVMVFGALCFYYPIYKILYLWLPQYGESLQYLIVVFPICIFESKTMFILNTFLKTLRKEKIILYVNILGILLNAVFCFFGVFCLDSIMLTLLGIVVALATRCYLEEVLLMKILGVSNKINIILEIFMALVFMMSGMVSIGIFSAVVYVMAYGVYLYLKRNQLSQIKNYFLNNRRGEQL